MVAAKKVLKMLTKHDILFEKKVVGHMSDHSRPPPLMRWFSIDNRYSVDSTSKYIFTRGTEKWGAINVYWLITLETSGLLSTLLSQPNNNHNPNNKTTITVVGMRLSNRWEPPPPTTTNSKLHDRARVYVDVDLIPKIDTKIKDSTAKKVKAVPSICCKIVSEKINQWEEPI